ncbi:MAG: MBL fold metallo-hydrolase [Aeropyrum sp.]|nr:MBL fold metallo-hydrolase [Aeropyrum sp.]
MSEFRPPIAIKTWIPIKSLGYVNVYAYENGNSVYLIDAGMYSARSIHGLIRRLKEKVGERFELEKIVITHFHVDHMTGAALLKDVFSADVFVSIGELELPLRSGSPDYYLEGVFSLYSENGVPDETIKEIERAHPALILSDAYRSFSSLELRPIYSGDILALGDVRLRAVPAPGHTPGHIILESLDYPAAFVGDSIIENITPTIILDSWERDPLGDYLKTLAYIAERKYHIAYSGHREPIIDPSVRAVEILRHHESRLKEVEDLLRRKGAATGYEVARELKWRTRYASWEEYPPMEKFFAIGEALAHLRRLYIEGRVEVIEKNGSRLYRPI